MRDFLMRCWFEVDRKPRSVWSTLPRNGGQLGMKRHNLQPSFRESSDSLRQQAASTNLPMPLTPASGNGVYAWAFCAMPAS